ncbi:MAG: hypothetical protein HKN24_03980 [Acidimicrobiales bacterium]|nr:hypothetical protein [Acidimicrobiales bacterium]
MWIAALAMLLVTAGTAAGEEHDHEEVPLHPHALLIGTGGDEQSGFTAVNCVDVAANQSLPLNAHHDHLHTGAAGAALFNNTSHFAVPLAPLSPWADCDELLAAFDVTIVRGNGNR